jgi:hypothetical protein
VTQSALSPCFITYPATPASKFQTAECASYALSTITVIGTCLTLVYEGSSDSADPVSRKARKLAVRQAQKKVTDLVDLPKEVVDTASGSCDSDESQDLAPPPAMNPFHYVMQHGRFPDAAPTTQQQRPEPAELTNAGNLWNAVPLRTCQYLDLEAAQVDSDTSEGSTGSSDGSLFDENFIVKDPARENHTAEELQVLQTLLPKTFSKRVQVHGSVQPNKFRGRVMVNGIIQFPVWKRGPALTHLLISGAHNSPAAP